MKTRIVRDLDNFLKNKDIEVYQKIEHVKHIHKYKKIDKQDIQLKKGTKIDVRV